MKLSELKKLTNNELASRFPFIVVREYNGELAKDEDGNYYLEIDGMHGWRDLLLCWAEKVKPIYDSITDENLKNNFYLMDVKEKWGSLRIDVSCIPTPKIDEYTSMAEHLSEWACLKCGKITKSSNNKHIIVYHEGRNVEIPFCKDCAKKDSTEDWKKFPMCHQRWIQHSKNPVKAIYSTLKRIEGNWYACFRSWKPDGSTEYIKYDCRELLEGMDYGS